jgi:hypothetical protein
MFPRFILKMIGTVVRRPVLRHLAAFEKATHHCRQVQDARWRQIVRCQANTGFGRDHGFGHIASLADFRHNVPIAGYDFIEPYIARMRRGDLSALVADQHVYMFALTSGTTAARKFIPVTSAYLADYRHGWNIWGMRNFLDHNEIRLRPIVQVSSDWNEFQTESGVPCGSVTGLTADMQKRIIRWLYCVPGCASRVKDSQARLYTVLRLSVPRPVGLIVTANPSTLINLARVGDAAKETLIRDIHDGTLSTDFDIATSIRHELSGRIRKRQPERARQLESIVNRTGTLYPRDYWSRFVCGHWTGGSVGVYLQHLPRYYGQAPVRDVGLIASEGRMTIPIVDGSPAGVLDITSHYFEFIPESEAESPNPTALAAHEVEIDRNYFIILTTSYGLYRYHIYDLVRITGFHHTTPIIEFLSKGSHFANLTGEKLSEYQVIEAMKQVVGKLGLSVTTYSMAPCWHDERPYYGLFIERGDLPNRKSAHEVAQEMDRRLCQLNMEYASKRQTLRLAPLRVLLIGDGSWKRWDMDRLAKTGGSPEQYKHPCLIPDLKLRSLLPVEEEIEPVDVPASGVRAGAH